MPTGRLVMWPLIAEAMITRGRRQAVRNACACTHLSTHVRMDGQTENIPSIGWMRFDKRGFLFLQQAVGRPLSYNTALASVAAADLRAVSDRWTEVKGDA